jgi:hypothetical protein
MPQPDVIVFDTNVLIPLILPASLSTALFIRLESAGWHVATTPQILDEVRDKLLHSASLRKWLKLSDQEIDEFAVSDLPALLHLTPGLVQALGAVPADPDTQMTRSSSPRPWKRTRPTSSPRTRIS